MNQSRDIINRARAFMDGTRDLRTVEVRDVVKALLIAVEALEDIRDSSAGAIPDPRLHADVALSHIRSLTLDV